MGSPSRPQSQLLADSHNPSDAHTCCRNDEALINNSHNPTGGLKFDGISCMNCCCGIYCCPYWCTDKSNNPLQPTWRGLRQATLANLPTWLLSSSWGVVAESFTHYFRCRAASHPRVAAKGCSALQGLSQGDAPPHPPATHIVDCCSCGWHPTTRAPCRTVASALCDPLKAPPTVGASCRQLPRWLQPSHMK